jgi:hypothetical protein
VIDAITFSNHISRELLTTAHRSLLLLIGFAAHHAIHHMAMIRLIATNHAGLEDSDLPADFGRAPSTVVHDQVHHHHDT